ncbi:hypothetical protein EN806_53950, partial [bacterium M00.F.Ca.ET.163.01.1.1]
MTAVNPDEGNSGPLSLMEAAAAYANPVEAEEPEEGQPEAEEEAVAEHQDGDETEPDDTEDEGQAESEEPEEEPQPKPVKPKEPAYADKLARVKMADGSELTVDELIKGNLRDRDYRQKTMALAEQERSFKAKSEQITQAEQQAATEREFMIQLLQSVMPQRPDPAMYMHDPIGFGQQDLAWRTRKEQLDYLVAQQQQTVQKRQAEEGTRVQQVRDREWQATLEAMPELRDANRLNSFAGEITKHGADYGFTPQEIQQSLGLDHRQILVLRDAIKWRNLQAQKSKVPAKVEGRPPVVMKSGTRP